MSYKVATSLFSPNRKARPIDCKTLTLDLDGLAKIMLCKLRMLIPVEKVPKEAIIMPSFSFSVTDLTSSRSEEATPP